MLVGWRKEALCCLSVTFVKTKERREERRREFNLVAGPSRVVTRNAGRTAAREPRRWVRRGPQKERRDGD